MVLKLKLDEQGKLTIPDGAFMKSNIKTIRIPYGKGNGVIPRNFLTGITVPATGLVLQVETNEAGTDWTNKEEKTGVLDFGGATANDTNYTGYKTINEQAFYNCSFLTEVNLGSIETVGKMAFYQNSNLKSVTCSNVKDINEKAFYNNSNLTTLDCAKTTNIGNSAFQNCNKLEKANCPSATMIGDYAFASCSNLSNLTISSAESLGQCAFQSTLSLKYLALPNTLNSIGTQCFEFSGLTSKTKDTNVFVIPKSVNSLGVNAFHDCNNLRTVEFESGSTLTSISERCFDNCDNLSKVTFPERLTRIENIAFWGCAFTELEFPSSIEFIGYQAFDGNFKSNLQSIKFKASTNNLTIQSMAFQNSKGLTSLVIEDSSTATLTIEGYAFGGCFNLTTLTLPDRNETKLNNNVFENCTNLKSIIITNSKSDLHIGNNCFRNCTSLGNTLTLENRKRISLGDYAFSNCSGLKKMIIEDIDIKMWTSVFSGCSSLSEIEVKESSTPLYMSSSVFSGCPIKALDFSSRPVWLGKLVNMDDTGNNDQISWGSGSIFQNCTSLSEIKFCENSTMGNYIGNNSFSGCTSLRSVSWGSSITNIGNKAFDSTALTNVDLSSCSKLTALNGFSNCTSLISVLYPTSITSIGVSCFSGSTSLTTVGSSSSNTNVVYLSSSIASIGNSAFSNCSAITIVKSEYTGELSLGSSVFSGCTSLTLFSQDTTGSLTYGENVFSSDSVLKYIVLPSNFNMSTSNYMLVSGLSQFSSSGDAYICFANGRKYYDFPGDTPIWVKINSSGSSIAKLAYYTGNGKETSGDYYEWSWTDTNKTNISVSKKTVSSTSSNPISSSKFVFKRKEERLSF